MIQLLIALSLLVSSSAFAVHLMTPAEIRGIYSQYGCGVPSNPLYEQWGTVNRDLHLENGYINRVAWFKRQLPVLREYIKAQPGDVVRLPSEDPRREVIRTLLANFAVPEIVPGDPSLGFSKEEAQMSLVRFEKQIQMIAFYSSLLEKVDHSDAMMLAATEDNYVNQVYLFARDYDYCGLLKAAFHTPEKCYSVHAEVRADFTGFPSYILPMAMGSVFGVGQDSGLLELRANPMDEAAILAEPKRDLTQSLKAIREVYTELAKCVHDSAQMSVQDLDRAQASYDAARKTQRESKAPLGPQMSRQDSKARVRGKSVPRRTLKKSDSSVSVTSVDSDLNSY